MKIVRLATGFAIGYVLGSRAGRDKYDQIVAKARQAQNHPAVTQVTQKAKQLLGTAADKATTGSDPVLADTPEIGDGTVLTDTSPGTPSPPTVGRSARRAPSGRPSPTVTVGPLA